MNDIEGSGTPSHAYVLVLSDRADIHQLVRDGLGTDTQVRRTQMAVPPLMVVTDQAERLESLAQSIWIARAAPLVVIVPDETTGMNALARGATQAIVEPIDNASARLGIRSALAARNTSDAVTVSERAVSREARIEVEEQLQHSARLATIGEIAAAVAHEINNPLQFMTVCLNELRAALVQAVPGHAGSDLRSLLDDALEGVERIRSITVELLPFARSMPSAIEDVDLSRVVRRSLRMMRNDLRHRAQIKCDLDVMPMLRGDPRRLSQVFTNLFLNAAQAIEEGDADENIIRVCSRHEGDTIRITVEDSGRGIPAAHLPRVFERFFTTKPSGLGTGLGMSVSQEIIRTHGGHIYVESELGRGTTVTIILPVRTALVTAPQPATPAPAARASLRILAVDDDLLVLKSYRRALGKTHSMTFADDGADALALLDNDAAFDVILCDLMMPNMDGPRFFEELTTRHPDLTDRIVFCSGGTFTPRAEEFVKGCRLPLLYKPVPTDELVDQLYRTVAKAETKHATPSDAGTRG